MRVGVIGSGAIGRAFSARAAKSGVEVVLANSRGPESLGEVVAQLGPGVSAGSLAEAAAQPIVLLAVPWKKLPSLLASLGPWNGRIVIDCTNPFVTYEPDFQVDDLKGRTSSEVVTDMTPGARLVKAFNTIWARYVARDPVENGGNRVIFLSGDHADAKAEVAALIEHMGFAAVDLGDLAVGGRLQSSPGPLAGKILLRMPVEP